MNHYLVGLMVAWQAEKDRIARFPLIAILQAVCVIALVVSALR